jgi:hypothetical protein
MSHYDDVKRALDAAERHIKRIKPGDATAEDNARQALRAVDEAKRAAERLDRERDDYESKYRRSRSDG